MLKAGFIGLGRRGGEHYRRLQQRSDVEVVAVCDIDEAVRKKAGSEIRFYTDYRDLLDKEELDLVVVATPARCHADHAVGALEAGAHVLCEKPLAWSLVEAWRIVDAAEKAKGICETGYQWRHNPTVAVARKALSGSGIALTRGVYYHTVPLVDSIRDKNTGGGQIFDQATHLIDLARLFAGNVREVYARYTLNARSASEFDNWDGYAVTMGFDSGAVGSFASTYALFLGHGQAPTLDVIGREVLVRFEGDRLTVTTPNGKKEYGPKSADFTAQADIHSDFIAAARGNRDLAMAPPADALRSLATTIAANLSARTGEVVDPEALISRARDGEDVSVV
jgi:predicted dehydrogenase